MSNPAHVRVGDVAGAVRALGSEDRAVCLHSSLRSFGFVEGSAEAVVRGFLDEGCTVMVPTFTDKEVAPPTGQSPPQNGWDYTRNTTVHAQSEIPYSPDSTDVARDMGAIPKVLLELPGRVRGDHPLDSFSAVGPLAHTLVDAQTSLEPYAPFRQLVELGGYVLLLGVGLNKMTLLHEAERQAGRNLFWRWVLDKGGETVSVRAGGCSEGFENLAPALAGLEHTHTVGGSRWRVFPARATLERAKEAIRAQPELTACGNAACERCADAVRGGPNVDAAFEARMRRSWR